MKTDILTPVSPQQPRLLCFGSTGLASDAGVARTHEERLLMDHAVRTAHYANAPSA